ncbi:MAG: CHAT domain-containing tetratricopeptide repeat protein [Bacteroidota bacterium]
MNAQVDTAFAHSVFQQAEAYARERQADSAGKYYEAATLAFIEAAETYEEMWAWDRVSVASRSAQEAYSAGGKFVAANRVMSKLLEVFARNFPDDPKKRVGPLSNIGRNYFYMDRFEDAAVQFELARENLRKILPFGMNTLGRISQDLGVIYQRLGRPEAARESYQEAMSIFEEGKDTARLANVYVQMSQMENTKGNLMAQYEGLQQALELLEGMGEPAPVYLAPVYLNLAQNVRQRGLFSESVGFAEQSMENVEKAFGPGHPQYGMALTVRSRAFMDMGRVKKARDGYQEACLIFRNFMGPEHSLVAQSYDDLANAYQRLGDLPKALRHLQAATDIQIRLFGQASPQVLQRIANQGVLYQRMERYEEAIQQFLKADSLRMSLGPIGQRSAGSIAHNLGISNLELGRYARARQYLSRAMKIQQGQLNADHPLLINIHLQIGKTYLGEQLYDLALEKCQQAFQLASQRSPQDVENICLSGLIIAEVYDSLGRFSEEAQLFAEMCQRTEASGFGAVQTHIRLWQAKADFETRQGDFPAAYQSYLQCLSLLDQLTYTLREESAQLILRDTYADIFSNGLHAASEISQSQPDFPLKPAAWSLMDQAKSPLLRYQIRKDQQAEMLPDSIWQAERKLQADIREIARQTHTQVLPVVEQQKLEKDLFQANFDLDSLQKILQEVYPGYLNQIRQSRLVDYQQIQASLPEGMALLTYLLGTKHQYALVLDQTTLNIVPLALPAEVETLLRTYRDLLLRPPAEQSLKPQATDWQLGHQLYQLFIQPLAADLPEKLLIVPDGPLNLLPFEALLSEPVDPDEPFHKQAFWIREKTISYAFSGSIWHSVQQANPSEASPKPFLAMAPSFPQLPQGMASSATRSSYLGPLEANQEEAQSLAQLLSGEVWLDSMASLTNFLDRAPEYAVLHLATHGKVHDGYPAGSFLAFAGPGDSLEVEGKAYPGLSALYLSDLYQMDLHAEMVVLSACETGLGKVFRGEGVSSLARGFTYAGAQSLVATLWRVSDRGSADFMALFYAALAEGKDKATALRDAKLALMRQRPEYAAPFYWSPYVLQGNTLPLKNTGEMPAWWMWLLGGGLLLGGAAFWWRRQSV